MDLFTILMTIFILSILVLMGFVAMYNKFQTYVIKINEVEAEIDSTLRKRFDLLNRSINVINGNVKLEKEALEIIIKLRSRKLSNFELDRILYDAINEFNSYKDTYPELNQVESFVKISASLNESEIEIHALRKYYNDVITTYNELVRKIPSSIVAKVFKYKFKNYFDNKDMTDEVVNDFKL
jgi:LemA protein